MKKSSNFFKLVFPVIFFFLYLLSHNISNKVRHTLLLLCELHFALLYSLQITLVSRALEKSGSLCLEILTQLGETLIIFRFITCDNIDPFTFNNLDFGCVSSQTAHINMDINCCFHSQVSMNKIARGILWK